MRDQDRKLLAVLAHPDDESFGMGGTLAYYAERQVQVHLVCATRGEAGIVSTEFLGGFDTVAQLREYELHCAAEALGLAGVHYLDYRDSGMQGSPDNSHPRALIASPIEEVAEKIALQIRKLRPQVVITFDPLGGYQHPDHIAIHRATVLAFEMAADPGFHTDTAAVYSPERLYFHIMPRTFIRLMVRVMRFLGRDPRRWGKNGDIDLLSIAEVDFPVHARIDVRSVLGKKEAAGACHASQGGGRFLGRATGLFARLVDNQETYMQASPPVEGARPAARDLFE